MANKKIVGAGRATSALYMCVQLLYVHCGAKQGNENLQNHNAEQILQRKKFVYPVGSAGAPAAARKLLYKFIQLCLFACPCCPTSLHGHQGCQPASSDAVFCKNRILKTTESASTFLRCIQLHKTAS